MVSPSRLLVALLFMPAMIFVPTIVAQEASKTEPNIAKLFPVENLPVWILDDSGNPRFDASVLISRIKNEVKPEAWKSGRARVVQSVEDKSLIVIAPGSEHSQLTNEISSLLETVRAFSEHDVKKRLDKNLELAANGGEQVMLFCTHADSAFYEKFMHARTTDTNLAKLLNDNYIVQCLPATKASILKKQEFVLVSAFGAEFTILSVSGEQVASTSFDSWDEKTLDVFAAFAERHARQFGDAKEVLAEGLREAKKQNKNLLLQMCGPDCGPCILLTRYLKSQNNLIEKDFVHVKLDRRMVNSNQIKLSYGAEFETIPWVVILSPEGKKLASGMSSKGNSAFPQTEFQQEHFKKILTSTANSLTKAEISLLINALPKLLKPQDND